MDAKVIVMINDMSRTGLIRAFGYEGYHVETRTDVLRYLLLRGYGAGNVAKDDIIEAWESDDPFA
jgi:hypothetical protein